MALIRCPHGCDAGYENIKLLWCKKCEVHVLEKCSACGDSTIILFQNLETGRSFGVIRLDAANNA